MLEIFWILFNIFLPQVINFYPILTVSIVSLICGFTIGFERELSDKPAGLRTTILVVLGSALFTFLSPLLADINTTRIAANVVVGIGFIGAGTIMREKGHVQGITTAATMWVCAALGMLIGAQFYINAFIVTAIIFLVLNILGRIEYLKKYKND